MQLMDVFSVNFKGKIYFKLIYEQAKVSFSGFDVCMDMKAYKLFLRSLL